MKLFFLTSQLQGLRLLDTFPWAFVLFGKIKKRITKFDLLIILFYSIFMIYGVLISTDNQSLLKVLAFLSFSLLSSRMKLNTYSNLTINFYIFILLGLIIEDVGINYLDFISPFVRDPKGAFFIFREASYFSLLLFSIIAFTRTIKLSHIIILFFIGIFTQSGLFWPLYFGLIIYKYSRNIYENFINFSLFSFLITIFYYLNNVKDFSFIYKFVEYADLLRLFINLTALNSQCIGTIFLHQCTQENSLIDLSSSYFYEWQHLTAQSSFFILFNFFGYPGILLIIFMLYLMYTKLESHRNKGFIIFNILVQMFIQGFLLSPLFFWVLSMDNKANNFKK